MNKNKIIWVSTILLVIAVVWFVYNLSGKNNSLLSPGLTKTETLTTEPVATSTPAPTPKTFKFDSSTDLKAELDLINPQVLDSDFDK